MNDPSTFENGRYIVNIFLDDIRECPEGFQAAHTLRDCLNMLIIFRDHVGVLSLDNDLGHEREEGRHVLLFMAENADWNLWPRKIRIHSANPVARDWMRGIIERYGNYRWDYESQEYVRNV